MYLHLRPSEKYFLTAPISTKHTSVRETVTPIFTAIEKQKCKARRETLLRPQGKFGFYCTTFHEMLITEQISPKTKQPN